MTLTLKLKSLLLMGFNEIQAQRSKRYVKYVIF